MPDNRSTAEIVAAEAKKRADTSSGEEEEEEEEEEAEEEDEEGEWEALDDSRDNRYDQAVGESESEAESEEDELVELEALDNPAQALSAARSPLSSKSSPPHLDRMHAGTGQPSGAYPSPHANLQESSTPWGAGAAGQPPMAGIGVLVQRLGGLITVVDLVEGGPAHLSGQLKIGQVVLEVDGQAVDQLSFKSVLQIIRGPVGSTISLMIQDMTDVRDKESGVRMVKMRRGLLPDSKDEAMKEDSGCGGARQQPSSRHSPPSKPFTARVKDELQSLEGGLLDGSSSEDDEDDDDEEEDDDDALDLSEMDRRAGGGGGGMRSEVVGDKGEDSSEEDDDASEDDDEMLNLEDMDGEHEDSSESDTLEELESLDTPPAMPKPSAAAASADHRGVGTPNGAAHGAGPAHAGAGSYGLVGPAAPGAEQPQQQRQPQQKLAPLCIKIDVEPTNKQNAGYSLMFNVEKVAQGLRYGVEIKDRKTMLKVHHRSFSGPEAVEWLTQHALHAFMEKEKCSMTEAPNERLRILARSAALLLGQRLLETEVFRQINKSKGSINVFEDGQSLFRFREDEKAGPVLNTRHVWNCRARPPVVVAADLVHKAILLHLSVAAVPPDETWPDWMAFLQVAEELQMVDISLLFRRAEVAFFLNLHNALMLHTHMHRGTSTGEALRSIKVCVCVCLCVCVCSTGEALRSINVYVCRMHACMHVCMRALYTFVCMYVCMRVCVCVRACM
jgi:hypothetical protein